MLRRALLSLPLGLLLSSCAQRPAMVVFFNPNSTTLDDAAKAVVEQASTTAKANPAATVHVIGFASPETGTVESNKALAQARAQSVADMLVADGVPPSRVHVEAWGAIAYGLTATESHRVQIVVGQ